MHTQMPRFFQSLLQQIQMQAGDAVLLAFPGTLNASISARVQSLGRASQKFFRYLADIGQVLEATESEKKARQKKPARNLPDVRVSSEDADQLLARCNLAGVEGFRLLELPLSLSQSFSECRGTFFGGP